MVEKVGSLTFERIKALQWNKIFHMFYVEPVIFLLVFAHSLSGTIMRNEIIYQACTTVFQYNESDCKQLGTKNFSERIDEIETEVQQYAANLFMIRTLLESIVPAICGIFIGSWSDHYGRKPLLIISMIGFSFTYLIAAAICQISYYYPVNPWYYILAVVPHSLLGGNCVFTVAIYCFISDVTDTKARPYRMMFMEGMFFMGLICGSLLSSFVYAATNATTTFFISGVLMCLGTIFTMIYVPESLHLSLNKVAPSEPEVKCCDLQAGFDDILTNDDDDDDDVADAKKKAAKEASKVESQATEKHLNNVENGKDNSSVAKAETNIVKPEKLDVVENGKTEKEDTSQKAKETANSATKETKETSEEKAKTAGLFSYIHIKDMLATCTKSRPYYDRAIIWLVTGTMFLSIFVYDGAMTVFYLFVREKFHWTVRDFTFYETVSHIVPIFGAIVGFLILRKVFRLSIVTLAILAFGSDILASIVRGQASEAWHLYLAVAVGALKSVTGPMCRTIVSNIVAPTDLGKIFSIKNILQSIAPFLAAPLYTLIYKESLKTYPGLFNIVSAVLYSISFIFLVIVLRFKYIHKEHYRTILK